MKRYLIILAMFTSLLGCEQSQETTSEQGELDSLVSLKKNKTLEVNQLENELDSLKNLRDSLESLSK